MTFGKWLSAKRSEADLTQEELATRAGISPNYVSALEREEPNTKDGSPRQPRRDKVKAIARALNVNVDEALRMAGYAPNQPEETHDILDLATVMFHDADRLTPEEREELLNVVRRVARGMLSERRED